MTICLGKSCTFGLLQVPFVNCFQFMYLVISLLVLRAGCGIWLYQFLIIAIFLLYRYPAFYSPYSSRQIVSVPSVILMWYSTIKIERYCIKSGFTSFNSHDLLIWYWKHWTQNLNKNFSQLMRLRYLNVSHRRPAKAQVSLRIHTVSPEPLLFAHMYGNRQRVQPKIRHLPHWMAVHVRLKNEFAEDEKYHNFMTWLIWYFSDLVVTNMKEVPLRNKTSSSNECLESWDCIPQSSCPPRPGGNTLTE